MFWDRVAGVYDIFGTIINRKAHERLRREVGKLISKTDEVLECACGTGLLSGVIARRCKRLVATDFSGNMLKRARKKYRNYPNIEFRKGDILQIAFPDESFDVVVAANVLHLLDEPYRALSELDRVCKTGGRIILPTYVNKNAEGKMPRLTKVIGKAGAGFKEQFTYDTYKRFIRSAGYHDVKYSFIAGRVSCALAVIKK